MAGFFGLGDYCAEGFLQLPDGSCVPNVRTTPTVPVVTPGTTPVTPPTCPGGWSMINDVPVCNTGVVSGTPSYCADRAAAKKISSDAQQVQEDTCTRSGGMVLPYMCAHAPDECGDIGGPCGFQCNSGGGCSPGFILSNSGLCVSFGPVAPCGIGYAVSPLTGNCEKVNCPPGMQTNEYGLCVPKEPTPLTCSTGYFYNSTTNHCEPSSVQSNPMADCAAKGCNWRAAGVTYKNGTRYSTAAGCDCATPTSLLSECPTGYARSVQTGMCVPPTQLGNCPTGYARNATGLCVAVPKLAAPAKQCPSGYRQVGNACYRLN
jgi:hypothetical protein